MGLWKASRLPGHPVPADDEGRVRRPVVAGAGWLAAAGVATLIGVAGIQLVGESLTSTPGGVLSQKQVGEALADETPAPGGAGIDGTPSADGSGETDASDRPGETGIPGETGGPDETGIPGETAGPGGTRTPGETRGPGETGGAGETSGSGETTVPGDRPGTTAAPAASQRTFSVRGGTATAVCRGGLAELEFWAPTQGYGIDKAEPGPAREVEVRFRSGHAKSELKIYCAGGAPTAEVKEDD